LLSGYTSVPGGGIVKITEIERISIDILSALFLTNRAFCE
jgi:hypothetical protein